MSGAMNVAALKKAWRALRFALIRPFGPRGKRSLRTLLLAFAAIVVWQSSFSLQGAKLDDKYQNTASSGVHADYLFVYFYWYLGLFPVMSDSAGHCNSAEKAGCYDDMGAPGAFSYEAAKAALARDGKHLYMDAHWTWPWRSWRSSPPRGG
jgi:hypothetical protein